MDTITFLLICICVLLSMLIFHVRDICITNDNNHYNRINRVISKLDEIIDKLDKIEKDRSN
jgi:hypothetical protein